MTYLQYGVLVVAMVTFCLIAIRSNYRATNQLQEQIDSLKLSVKVLLTPHTPRLGHHLETRQCANCDRSFQTDEATRRYCCVACKSAYGRRRKRAAKLLPNEPDPSSNDILTTDV